MNRQGKKSSLTRAKQSKAKSKPKANSRRGLSKSQGNTRAKQSPRPTPKRINSKKLSTSSSSSTAIADNNSRLQQNLTAKSRNKRRTLKKVDSSSPKKPVRGLKLATYVVTITIGLSTILGSLVSMASSFQAPPENNNPTAKVQANSQNQAKLDNLLATASLGKEIGDLKSRLEELAAEYPDLEPELFVVDLDTKGFVNFNSKVAISSASTIKLPILVAFFQDVDRGIIRLEEQLVVSKDFIAGGSGNMQYEAPGTRFSALETADRMMTISDNTATNMLIARMGGMSKLNQRFISMGLTATKLRNPLPDLTGTNTTSSADLGNLLVKLDRGQLISLRSRDRLLYIMRNIVRNTLLPQGLDSEAIIAHKTGDIKSVLGDVGLVDMPSGKRYIISALVKRPDNSPQAKKFIQQASRITYQYFKTPQTTSLTPESE
ncbi:MAG: serine hydrolase [Cyanobacteria bacterium J06623_7]